LSIDIKAWRASTISVETGIAPTLTDGVPTGFFSKNLSRAPKKYLCRLLP
jgi:hypothetical protein